MFEDLIANRVRPLAEALVRGGLERLRVAGADTEIELSRAARAGEDAGARRGAEPAAAEQPAEYEVLTAGLVGRVRFPRPPVPVGALVDSEREIASIESLGIRNPVRARGTGRVAVIYVEEGQAVDYGAPLVAIERLEL